MHNGPVPALPSTAPVSPPATRTPLALSAFLLTLLVGLLATAAAIHEMRSAEDREAELGFRALVQPVAEEINVRVHAFEVLARTTAGFVEASADITPAEWQTYVSKVGPASNWTGFRGLALAYAIAEGREAAFAQLRRRAGQEGFHVWRRSAGGLSGLPVLPITLMAPDNPRNRAIVGFDFSSDPDRSEAIALARDTGHPAVTAPVKLLNDAGQRETAVVLFAPVFRSGPRDDRAARRERLAGTVVVGLGVTGIVEELMSRADLAAVSLSITDAGSERRVVERAVGSTAGRFQYASSLGIGGRDWLLQFASTPAFDLAVRRDRSTLIGAAGLIMSLLAAMVISGQLRLRRRAEARAQEITAGLRDSEARFRLVAEAAGEGLWDQNFVNGQEYLSPRLEHDILGYDPGSFLHRLLAVGDLIHPEDRDRWLEARRAHLEQGLPYYAEYRVKHADGHWIWVASRGKAEFDEAGTVLRMAGAMTDISERREQQQLLENQHRFLREVLDSLPDPVVVKRPEAEVLIVNRAYVEWLGRTEKQIIGRSSFDLVPVSVAEASAALDRACVTDGGTHEVEVLCPDQRHGGAWRHVLIVKTLGHGLAGEALVIGVHHDVTALRESETRFRELTAMASDWFWEMDAELRFTEMSAGVRVGGRTPQRVIGQHRWDLPIDWTPEQVAAHRALLEAHQPFAHLEYRVRSEQGDWRWYSITGQPRFDANGQFVGYRGTGIDITERRAVQEELRQHRDNLAAMVEARTAELTRAMELAEEASRTKTDFLANMSHELRTPLHAILSFAHLGLTKGKDTEREKLTGWFERIHSSAKRLLGLVNDLLDLSKLEAGKMHIETAEHDLALMVREVAGDLAMLAESRQLEFDLPPPDLVVTAQVDRLRFLQVLHNLFSNAIKFSRPGTAITVELNEATMSDGRRASDQTQQVPAWRLVVLDEGIGIPDEELHAVFDKFVQSSKSKSGAGGTGLGLSICREIVEAHRGLIRAYNRHAGAGEESEPLGAAFEILLPRDPTP